MVPGNSMSSMETLLLIPKAPNPISLAANKANCGSFSWKRPTPKLMDASKILLEVTPATQSVIWPVVQASTSNTPKSSNKTCGNNFMKQTKTNTSCRLELTSVKGPKSKFKADSKTQQHKVWFWVMLTQFWTSGKRKKKRLSSCETHGERWNGPETGQTSPQNGPSNSSKNWTTKADKTAFSGCPSSNSSQDTNQPASTTWNQTTSTNPKPNSKPPTSSSRLHTTNWKKLSSGFPKVTSDTKERSIPSLTPRSALYR